MTQKWRVKFHKVVQFSICTANLIEEIKPNKEYIFIPILFMQTIIPAEYLLYSPRPPVQ